MSLSTYNGRDVIMCEMLSLCPPISVGMLKYVTC